MQLEEEYDRLMRWSDKVLGASRTQASLLPKVKWGILAMALLITIVLFAIFLCIHCTNGNLDFMSNLQEITSTVASIISIVILLQQSMH